MKKLHFFYVKETRRVYIEYKYNKAVSDDIKLTGAEYDRKMRHWFYLLDFHIVKNAVKTLSKKYEVTVSSELNTAMLELRDKPDVPLVTKDYAESHPWARDPFTHQKESMNRALSADAFLLALDMGMGKTYTSLEIGRAHILAGRARKILISCPNHLKYNWKKEINIAMPDMGLKVAVLDGTKAKRQKTLRSPHDILIMNHENCRLEDIKEMLKEIDYDMLIIDEIHAFRNPYAKQSEGMYQISTDIKYKYGLTGTPISGKDITGYFGIFRILDPSILGFNSASAFKKYFCIIDNSKGYEEILDYKHLHEFYSKIGPYSISYKIDEVLDMPQRMHRNQLIEFTKKDYKKYKEFEKQKFLEFQADLETGEMTATNALTKMLRLRQITSGFVTDDESGHVETVNKYKIDTLKEILTSELEGHKVVIACNFVREIEDVIDLCKKLGIGYVPYYGAIDSKQRHENVERFWNDEECLVLVGMMSTFIGFNAEIANHMIIYSQTYSHDQYDQACARIYRPSQKHPCVYIHLVVDKTIDVYVQDVLQGKGDFIEEVRQKIKGAVNAK